jgi:hypothetical protein
MFANCAAEVSSVCNSCEDMACCSSEHILSHIIGHIIGVTDYWRLLLELSSLWVNSFWSWNTGTVCKPRGRETSAVWSRNQRTGEEQADWEDSFRAVVNCRVCKLATALGWCLIKNCECPINSVLNPKPKVIVTLPRSRKNKENCVILTVNVRISAQCPKCGSVLEEGL